MTEVRTPQRTFGRVLGETYTVANKLHLQTLDRVGSDFLSWVVFTLLTERGESTDRATFVADASKLLDKAPAVVEDQLGRMSSAGHLTSHDGTIELTDAGRTTFAAVRADVIAATGQLVDGISAHDVETAEKVLSAVAGKAAELLAR